MGPDSAAEPPLEKLAFQGLTWPFSRQNHTFRTALWKLEMSERDTSHYAHVLVHAYIAQKKQRYTTGHVTLTSKRAERLQKPPLPQPEAHLQGALSSSAAQKLSTSPLADVNSTSAPAPHEAHSSRSLLKESGPKPSVAGSARARAYFMHFSTKVVPFFAPPLSKNASAPHGVTPVLHLCPPQAKKKLRQETRKVFSSELGASTCLLQNYVKPAWCCRVCSLGVSGSITSNVQWCNCGRHA